MLDRVAVTKPARRYAAAMADKKIIDRLNEIAALYDELVAGQDSGPTDRE